MTSHSGTASLDRLDQLLLACGQGDQVAFEDLYDAVSSRVHGLVLRILRDHHQAEEVTHEVLLEAWQSAGRFDPERGSAYAWLLTLAHRRAVDRVRSSESARRRDAADVGGSHETAFDQTFDRVAERVEAVSDAARVRAALATLTPMQFEVIELSYFGGHTVAEVARALKIPVGTARTRVRNGLIRLRGALADSHVAPV